MLKKRNSLLIIIFSILVVVTCLVFLRGQTTKETCPAQSLNKKQEDALSQIKKTFPQVEYSSQVII